MFGLDIFQQFFKTDILYKSRLRAYPITTRNSDLENGDKIILPESAMLYINGTSARYPLMFRVKYEEHVTYCGVVEFSSANGECYIPRWIMNKLEVFPGEFVSIENVIISKASFVKLKFRDGTFGELSNPRAILENKLKSYSVLMKGDYIKINHLDKDYIIDILETKPKNVVDIVECDVEVDIEYAEVPKKEIFHEEEKVEEPDKSPQFFTQAEESVSPKPDSLNKFRAKKNYFQGKGHSLKESSTSSSLSSSGFRRQEATASRPKVETRFTEQEKKDHFKGVGHKLCGSSVYLTKDPTLYVFVV